MLPLFDRRVVVLGDAMLDRFLYGKASRLSPEAPVPIVQLERQTSMAGGAGNVMRNIASLGGDAILIAMAGTDQTGDELAQRLPSGARLLRSPAQRTTVKLRVVAAHQQVVRVDDEAFREASPREEADLLALLLASLDGAAALVLSDYGKGVLTPLLCASAIAAARQAGIPCLVDPKGRDYARYDGADLLTPNARELAEASGLPTATATEVEAAARSILERTRIGAVLVTRGDKGMMLVPRAGPAITESAAAREVFDVSGAGDTVIATLALALAGGAQLPMAMHLANAAAGVVVGKLGTAPCSADELIHALREADGGVGQVLPLQSVARLALEWRSEGLRVGFANGCFDILHAGHALMLREARRHCDKLIVALNSDASVTRLKGPSRPLNALADRATVIGALAFVDAVTAFAEDTPLDAILAIRPDRLFKGADYALADVVGARELTSWGGQTILLDILPGRSTTRLVERARCIEPAAVDRHAATLASAEG
jgi:D-beta-D-heptose 7-phosphate kinase/D-beta-D-heptose 1-phosphate adenosyltransferase